MQAAPPAHAVVCCRSPAVVEFILSLHPVGSYLCWCSDQSPASVEIFVRDCAPALDLPTGKSNNAAQFRRIPLRSTVEADLRAAGYRSATCALPPPRFPAHITPTSSTTPTLGTSDAPPRLSDLCSLPGDLWSFVIAMLDTQSLLRFRLVSKVHSYSYRHMHGLLSSVRVYLFTLTLISGRARPFVVRRCAWSYRIGMRRTLLPPGTCRSY